MTSISSAGHARERAVSAVPGRHASAVFLSLWSFALFLLILNLGHVFNLGNLNALEKSAFLAAAIVYLRGKQWSTLALVALGLVAASIFVPAFLTSFAGFSWQRTVMAFVALMALAAYFVAAPTAQERDFMLKSIAWIPVILMAYGVLLLVATGRPLSMRDHTGAVRLGAATIPSFLGIASYAGAVAAAFVFAGQRRLLYLGLAVAALLICLLSGTRSPAACATASVGLILLLAMPDALSRSALVVFGTLLTALFLLTWGDQILIRILSGSSSGREQIWSVLSVWSDRFPLTGVGFGHQSTLIPEYLTRLTQTVAAHNEYLRLLVEVGMIAAPLFFLGMAMLFTAGLRRDSRGSPKVLSCALLLIAAFFAYASTDNAFLLTYALLVPLAVRLGAPHLAPAPS